jgi:flavin prenyltransferase
LFGFPNRQFSEDVYCESWLEFPVRAARFMAKPLLQKLQRDSEIELYLTLTRSAQRTVHFEIRKRAAELKSLAHFSYPVEDIGSQLASGFFLTDGMVIASGAIHSMPDVCLRERRKLIPMVRETPFHLLGHLRGKTSNSTVSGTLPDANEEPA